MRRVLMALGQFKLLARTTRVRTPPTRGFLLIALDMSHAVLALAVSKWEGELASDGPFLPAGAAAALGPWRALPRSLQRLHKARHD